MQDRKTPLYLASASLCIIEWEVNRRNEIFGRIIEQNRKLVVRVAFVIRLTL
jgi:hypothetical protein